MVARATQKLPIRDQVIAAATRLFAARGFEATPLQDIADEVGVTKQAVLHHFPSKELIRRGVLDAILAHWRDELPRLLLSATASDERFDAVLDEVYRFFAASPERARFIVREALDRPAEARDLVRAITPILRGIAGYIRTGLGDRSDDIDPDAYVLHVMQMIIGAAAVAEVTTGMLDASGQARYDRELARIAKASLFGRRHAATRVTEPARRKRGRRS
jgi:AcrR family transcriptional regulator